MNFIKKIVAFFGSMFKTETRAELNERLYRDWLSRNLPSHATAAPELVLCYTDRNGNNYYQYNDLLQMPQERALKLDAASQAAIYGLDNSFLSAMADNGIAYFKDGASDADKYSRLWYDLNELKDRLDNSNIERLYVHLGALLFLIDNENPYTVNDLTTARKIELAAKDDDLRAFFLNIAHVFTRNSKTERDNDTVILWAERTVKAALGSLKDTTEKP